MLKRRPRHGSWPDLRSDSHLITACRQGDSGILVVESVPGVFYWEEESNGRTVNKKVTMCKEEGCSEREQQLRATGDQRKSRLVAKRWQSLDTADRKPPRTDIFMSQTIKAPEDHDAKTESAILRRDSMRHLGDWFYPDGDWGWCVLFVAMLVHVLSLGPLLGGGQVLSLLFSSRLGTETIVSSLLPYLALAMSQLMEPFTGCLVSRTSPRLPAVIGGLALGLGWLFTSFSTRLHQVVISLLLMLAPGLSLLHASATAMICQYFKRKRPITDTMLTSATGISVFLLSLFLRYIASNLGWRLGLQSLAATVSVSSLCCLAYRPASMYHPQRPAIIHLKEHMRLHAIGHPRPHKPRSSTILPSLSLLASSSVRYLLFSSIFSSSLSLPFFLLAPATRAVQIVESSLLWLQLILGLSCAFGSVLAGTIIHFSGRHIRLASRVLCQVSLFTCGSLFLASGLLLPSTITISLLLPSCLLYGLSWGIHATSYRILVWHCLRSRFPQLHAFQLAVKTIPETSIILVILVLPSLGCCLAGTGLIIASVGLVGIKASTSSSSKRRLKKEAAHCSFDAHNVPEKMTNDEKFKEINKVEAEVIDEEPAVHEHEVTAKEDQEENNHHYIHPPIYCDLKENFWQNSMHGITSCNKVSNRVLLDEYRQNLSAALAKSLTNNVETVDCDETKDSENYAEIDNEDVKSMM